MFIESGGKQYECSLPGFKEAVKKSPQEAAGRKSIIRRINIRITGIIFLFLFSAGLFIIGLYLLTSVPGEYRPYIIIGLNTPLIALNIIHYIIRARRKTRSQKPNKPLSLEKFLIKINREYQTDYRVVSGI